ncbi:helix-turn-helix domain-containing protein [Bacillus sp. FJAT-27231]|uniref:helix-turn-helix domain-containing protein n=1 Tax=Bacillus sp. FJAT-27231 TaxID=1679168 RepID=UPI000670ABB5|nr:helix-turn-helix transcriptional regulator [Bacillus sp. FJAT-27231]
MNSESMAAFIRELRKSKNMTQKELAERLNITDKAVSKWERGLSYPDISILSSLADILGVSVSELLNGERSAESSPELEIVETTLRYANKVTSNKRKSVDLIAKMTITVICLLSILVCMICDVAVSGHLTWSRYPVASMIFVWLIIVPLFHFKRNKVRKALFSLSIFITPFLFALNQIMGGTKLLLPLGIPLSLIVVCYIWGIYLLFTTEKMTRWTLASISIVTGIPLGITIDSVISKFVNQPIMDVWDLLSYGMLVIAAMITFFIGRKGKQLEPRT